MGGPEKEIYTHVGRLLPAKESRQQQAVRTIFRRPTAGGGQRASSEGQ